MKYYAIEPPLDCNNIVSFPESMSRLTSLEHLDLSSNHLTLLPESISNAISNLRNLNEIDLRGNNFSKQYIRVLKQQFSHVRRKHF